MRTRWAKIWMHFGSHFKSCDAWTLFCDLLLSPHSQWIKHGGHLHYSLGLACTWLRLVHLHRLAGPNLNQKFDVIIAQNLLIWLLHFQTKAVCSWRSMVYSGMRAVLSPSSDVSQARRVSIPEWPAVNAVSHAQPKLSRDIFTSVNVHSKKSLRCCPYHHRVLLVLTV